MLVNIQFEESSSNLSWVCLSETLIRGSSNLILYNYQWKIHFRRKISVEKSIFSSLGYIAKRYLFSPKLPFFVSEKEFVHMVHISDQLRLKMSQIKLVWISKTVSRILEQFDSQNFGCRTSQILTKLFRIQPNKNNSIKDKYTFNLQYLSACRNTYYSQ